MDKECEATSELQELRGLRRPPPTRFCGYVLFHHSDVVCTGTSRQVEQTSTSSHVAIHSAHDSKYSTYFYLFIHLIYFILSTL